MATATATYDRYVADYKRTADSAEQPRWLRDLRKQAIEHFSDVGFPTARKGNEPWKYTNVGPIAAMEFAHGPKGPEPSVEEIAAVAPWCTVWHEAVFINGRFSPALSASHATHEPREGLAGATVGSLAEALTTHPEVLRQHLTRHVSPDYDGFTALNTAFLEDGAFVFVPDDAEVKTHIQLVFVTTADSGPLATYPRTLIVSGRNSRVTVVESYVTLNGPAFIDAVTEIATAEGARIDHYRVLLDRDSYHVGTTRVAQARDSSFRSTSFATGPRLARNDFAVLLDNPGAECQLRGLYVGAGSQHIDNYLTIDHTAPHCKSRLYYKGILDDESRAVFGGMVLVRQGAVKTDSHQEDKNLLLSEKAEVDSKPSLEIYCDDVLCGHGATAGALAEDALFYMQSRGISESDANRLLIKGFANDVLDETIEPLREFLENQTMAALPRFGAPE
jgi:Fe-S cluster assembly protein SufD